MKFRGVLDHGFIELLDIMGTDRSIAQAARVSYGGKDHSVKADYKLIHRLLKDRHTSPFEMVELKWRVRAPIFVARQWVRHRTANWSEFSLRYKEPGDLDPEWLVHVPDQFRLQDTKNKQGSTGGLDRELNRDFRLRVDQHATAGRQLYHDMVHAGVSREQAREHLGLNLYTDWVWKNDLHNTLHFLELRTAPDAQEEIRVYAAAIEQIMSEVLPWTMWLWRHRELSWEQAWQKFEEVGSAA